MSLSSQKCRALCQEEHVSVSYQTESLFQLHGKVPRFSDEKTFIVIGFSLH
jgi:hypothetical protein